jgi:hypothetical protein
VGIGPGAKIKAQRLRVSSRLALTGDSSLEAVDNDYITITTGTQVAMSAQAQRLPQLDLGVVGAEYSIVPAAIYVEIPPGGLGTSSHQLIAGATLTNCEEWASKVTFVGSDEFEAVCTSATASSRKMAAEGVTYLVVRSISYGGGDPGKLSVVPIVVGVVVGVVVITGVGIGIFLWRRKKVYQVEQAPLGERP